MTERELLTRDQVARKLGHTGCWFNRNRKSLEREDGFPPAVLGRGRGARWDPAAIDAWLDRQMPPDLRAPEDPIHTWREELRIRIPEAVGGEP